MAKVAGVLCLALSAVLALPTDWVQSKLDIGLMHQYVGNVPSVDSWFKGEDVTESARFVPDSQIVYHLFTRQNPTVSQPLLMGVAGLIGLTNYSPARRTVLLLHGWIDSATADFNSVLVPALPTDWVQSKLDIGLMHQYVGNVPSVDSWFKGEDVTESARFVPDSQIVYHLFTRQNPTVSQPLLMGVAGLIGLTNYSPARRTVLLLHGWIDSATADFNSVLVPAFLSAEDVNVIVVDWSAGAATVNYVAAVANTVSAGESVARFIWWLNSVTGATPRSYHLVGHSLGGHMVGVVGRNLQGEVAYITALDPMFALWNTHADKLRPTDAVYTEVIHTNAGRLGYIATLGDVDFYPNGGSDMPGCDDQDCDHHRSFYYLAESLMSAGFNGRRCASYLTAMTGNCGLLGTLHMGGLVPKTGSSGIYWLQTNAAPPFSQ